MVVPTKPSGDVTTIYTLGRGANQGPTATPMESCMKTAFTLARLVPLVLPLMCTVAFAQQIPGRSTYQGTSGDPLVVQQGSTPNPDPTKLTADAIQALRGELTRLWDERFANLTKQIDRNQLRLDLADASVKSAIIDSEKLTSEKFKGLSDQQVQRDNNLALALTAQQKSVADQNLSNLTAADKAEKNFKEQIAGIQNILAQQDKTSADKINDLKDRITTIESASTGAGGAVNWIAIGVGLFFTIVGGIMGVVSFIGRPVPVPVPVVQYDDGNGNGSGRRRNTR